MITVGSYSNKIGIGPPYKKQILKHGSGTNTTVSNTNYIGVSLKFILNGHNNQVALTYVSSCLLGRDSYILGACCQGTSTEKQDTTYWIPNNTKININSLMLILLTPYRLNLTFLLERLIIKIFKCF
ncbi:hypothetical protein QE152_g38409 [Popillia japonica]|uniref:Uncharacterized protein n=1 Tax=Popillia japonica TaxID=7064 RepID=A0AAW1HXT8_POPJA